ncbi:MAG TPA: undecaprenyldiphospho-muramoylpentapeptide beta-N-acetylglucosaminyltransferase [Verrucomicrobiae bacterium]|nr:undecaprenyldiphospho-muramoylpentapeptide beta-N-acetylglucosaminyltransferase [Verrucomicrobiae bacterium]
MKVMIACGGTGGHLFPGVAVAEALQARHHEVRLLVSEKAIDRAALGASTICCSHSDGIGVEALPAVGYEGAGRLIPFCLRLARATRGCVATYDEFGPDVVLGMGGFTSAPAMLGARWFRKRGTAALIHESNAVPGKANRWAARVADHVAVGLADCARYFGHKPVTVTGTPVRAALRRGKVADAPERLGLTTGRMTVLIVGGSQGAHGINESVAAALPWLRTRTDTLQFVHLTGSKDERIIREAYRENGVQATVMSFCSQMELAYSVADMVVARSGASTLTEIAAFGLPSILVPYPHAAGNHQWYNARVFERAGAARLIEEPQPGEGLRGESLANGVGPERGRQFAKVIGDLVDDDTGRSQMSRAARSLAVDDAADRIATLLEQYGR